MVVQQDAGLIVVTSDRQEELEREQAAWRELQETPAYVERIQRTPVLFDTECHETTRR